MILRIVLLLVVLGILYAPIEVYARWEKRIDRIRRERKEDREVFNEVVFGDLWEQSAYADRWDQ